jgi:signal transduction histidine kinase/CheY-like chemotaxis protein/CHASE3 domain sensor protein
MANPPSLTKLGASTSISLFLGMLALFLAFIVGGIIAYVNTRTLRNDAQLVTQTHEVLSALDDVLALTTDAETGQRGFVITGDERYLHPYNVAVRLINQRLDRVDELMSDEAERVAELPELRSFVAAKLEELAQGIEARRTQGFEAAQALVVADRGRELMTQIREKVDVMQRAERRLRTQRIAEMGRAYQVAVTTGLLTTLVGVGLVGVVGYLLRQAMLRRARQDWLQSGQIQLSSAMGGDQSYEDLGQNILRFFAEYLDAQAGAFFVKEGDGFKRVATYGVPANDGVPERFALNDRLLGQAARDRRAFFVPDVPDGYLTFGSALGHGKPRHLAIVPVIHNAQTSAVMEFGFHASPDDRATELFERVAESIGPAVRSVEYRAGLQNLLEETQRQSEELQAQGEELRVTNEELEEQSRALRESQVRLENQQAELEQTNAQLEEQTQLLELERDQVTRSKRALEMQAVELERASQYKSDFLANMSHELRTPLNSSLILAKLLADNQSGNLTAEQVEFAETIRTAGNDLLTLINDILDLSKIEAGHMELRAETFQVAHLLEDIKRAFQPVADDEELAFRAHMLPGCPDTISTDRQRLEQILKNLLSNAFKFTERGEIELAIRGAPEDRIAFAVTDSGIGIPKEQQEMIFEAFRQADAAASRSYGGTGLGLSISRQLTRLLGGEIHLASEEGKGSTFTVIIPVAYDASLIKSNVNQMFKAPPAVQPTALPSARSAVQDTRQHQVADDRDRVTAQSRAILVVEDDVSFARILSDLAHELDFACLIATTAEEALATALQYRPNAVILDIGLPDHTGLWVLDRLKHEQRTRHIPVHVISADDYAESAYALGAVGHMLKPVQREALVSTLRQLEARLAQRMGRVLIVEDDPVQRDGLQRLLGSQEVETIGVATAAECLAQLKDSTFDCMVLDLTLPDASGYTLLETLSREDAYAFPPVIVYTGRQLSEDEEQRLRKYSKSIIIKGAKSPERLLDEVTLFLHRVVSDLPPEQQRMLEQARSRDATIEGRRILVVEDDVRNVFALTSMLEPRGAVVQIARNGREALDALEASCEDRTLAIDMVLMDVMMPEMDGITAVREIRKQAKWKKLPIIMLTAKAMQDDQETCLAAGANDYMAKPLDVEKLLSLVRVWMPR